MIFFKTVASGNDFIHVEESQYRQCFPDISGKNIISLCDRKNGAGADGVTIYRQDPQSVHFRIFNRDGSEAELSGNGMAGVAALMYHRNKSKSPVVLDTIAGRRTVTLLETTGNVYRQQVDLGTADFSNTRFFPFLKQNTMEYRFEDLSFFPVSVGNPHAVLILERMETDENLIPMGRRIAASGMFPEGTNIEMVFPSRTESFRVFFYERGVGPTDASTTGSAAVFSVLKKLGRISEKLSIESGEHPVVVTGKNKIYIENFTKIVYKGIFKP